MNKVFAIGRLVADPTLNQKDGVSILNFRLAADTRKKDAQGNYIACFYRVALWRRHAEVMAPLLHKGDRISVSGDFVPSTYTDTNGVPRVSMDIENADVELLTTRTERAAAAAPPNPASSPMPAADDDEAPF